MNPNPSTTESIRILGIYRNFGATKTTIRPLITPTKNSVIVKSKAQIPRIVAIPSNVGRETPAHATCSYGR